MIDFAIGCIEAVSTKIMQDDSTRLVPTDYATVQQETKFVETFNEALYSMPVIKDFKCEYSFNSKFNWISGSTLTSFSIGR